MKIRITGISGYLGIGIANELRKLGHEVAGIDRKLIYGSVSVLANEIESCDAIINLAGAPILQRWTDRKKRLIHESRARTTRNLVSAINSLPAGKQPKKFISASAVGIYKSGGLHNENSTNFDSGFLGTVATDWEKPTNDLPLSVQKVIFRIGIVIGKDAKTITNLIMPFKFGLGATIGNGKQAFPFVHESDVIKAFVWAIEDFNQNQIFNLVAPTQISNSDFTKALAKALNRPAILTIPEFVLKLILGEAAVLLTESPAVEPKNLIDAGFEFQYTDINSGLSEIVKTNN